ncbi:Ger(x)C family spore germination protein [Paenibacillus tengchongensis]|uniref:Ger(x)C family spore germination protein n=1 Tax=Paenibacillus tengchongensis TaxID=2608684 RepID=UPI00124D1A9F|nr:Ger(x)C family spore germination protein [Paenibacillus tengchongensis]
MKLLKIAVSVLLLLNLTGCWSRVELDELTFIFGMYVDAGEDPGTVEVSISAPLPNRLQTGTTGGEKGKGYSMVSKTAKNITDAVILIQKDLSRRLEISHIKAVVIGKEYAAQGISELLDWFKRQPEFPLGTYIMGAPGKAKEIAELSPIFEQLPDQVLMNFSKGNMIFATTVKDCVLAESYSMGYAMNYLSFGTNPEQEEQGKPVKWAGIQGVMLFQESAMKRILGVEDSRALSWAAGHFAGQLTLPLYTVKWEGDSEGTASALFYGNSASRSMKMTREGPIFYVKLKGRASITYFRDNAGKSAREMSGLITKKVQEKLKTDIEQSLRKTQEAGVDVLQLGVLMEWNAPEEWRKLKERWIDYYKQQARIVVTAQINIDEFGAIK